MPHLRDESENFEVTMLGSEDATHVVLFAAGRGGDPARHLATLEALAGRGAKVVAPRFPMLSSPRVTAADLSLRARRLARSVEAFAGQAGSVSGVGHSIGGAMLLGLAGADLWTITGERVEAHAPFALGKLALLAPALDFVRAPGALVRVDASIMVWAGTEDRVVPPAALALLTDTVGVRAKVEVRSVEGANHFSFMDVPPPQTSESLPDRDAFLARLHAELGDFVLG